MEDKTVKKHFGRWQKGVTGNAKGRPPGRKNKRNEIIDQFLDRSLEGGVTRFEAEMNTLSGKAYIDAFLALLEFKRGKIARTVMSTADGSAIDVKQVFLLGGKEIVF